MKTEYSQFWLTCADGDEAGKIASTLLEMRLIVCAKQLPITSDYRWRGKIEHSKEVLLILDGKSENFEKIEAEVAKLHSYNTFVLHQVGLTSVSNMADKWMREELDG